MLSFEPGIFAGIPHELSIATINFEAAIGFQSGFFAIQRFTCLEASIKEDIGIVSHNKIAICLKNKGIATSWSFVLFVDHQLGA
ncbi:MAG: hypothetical protein IPI22_15115 [Bacteroidetes bacterium]|nr:hypothetical protein [Bacteroidota bacterium]